MYIKRRRTLVLGGGRPRIRGWAWALSWAVATWVAWAISSGSAKDCPARAWRPEDPPPALLHVQPASALGDEGVPDPGMVLRVRRQRTFSASKICRTWLRPTVIPASQATGQGYPGSTAPGRVHH